MTGPPAALRGLFRDLDGWLIPRAEAKAIAAARSAETYGEIMPTAAHRMLRHLALGPRDRFFDLGCGIGRVVVHAAITIPLAACVGIELSATRCRHARRALLRARQAGLVLARRCSIRGEDFMRARLDDATVVYTCSTAFPSSLMRRLADKLAALPRLHTLATLQDLDPHPAFALAEVLRLDMSWRRRAKLHVYRVR